MLRKSMVKASCTFRALTIRLDTVPTLSSTASGSSDATITRPPSTEEMRGRQHTSAPYPPSSSKYAGYATAPANRRYSESTANANERVLAYGSMTGCQISAPISLPSHYPATSTRRASSRSSAHSSTHHSACPPVANRRCASPSSVSTGSSSADSSPSLTTSSSSTMPSDAPPRIDTSTGPELYPTFVTPDTPRWARPMRYINAMSTGSWGDDKSAKAMQHALVAEEEQEQDFDQDMFKVDEEDDGPVEVIKGEGCRIAVRSSTKMYEILVWLPGFS